jgi:hypothetical protein
MDWLRRSRRRARKEFRAMGGTMCRSPNSLRAGSSAPSNATVRKASPSLGHRGQLLRFRRPSISALLMAIRAATAALMIFALLLPANAQFCGDSWGGRQPQRQQPYNPSGGFWGDRQWERSRYPRQRKPERKQPPDYSRAPPATPRKDATIKIVVVGDANADWPTGLKMPSPRSPKSASCASIAPIPGSSATGSAAISSGRRWRARSSRPRNQKSS